MFFPAYTDRKYATVRYAFPLVVMGGIFVGLAALITESSSYVTIKTDAKTVAKDEQFIIDVSVTAHVPVNAVDLIISYDKDQIEIEGIDKGTSVITLWAKEPYFENGNIYLQGGTFRKGFIGQHTVARIKAHGIKSGEARVVIKNSELVAGDGKGSAVAVTENEQQNETQILVTGTDGVITAKADLGIVTDTDGDGDVDLVDISSFMAAWFTKGNTYDFNGDGKMTFKDFSILLAEAFLR